MTEYEAPVAKPIISRTTRQRIFDGFRIEDVDWAGREDEVAFLSRLVDLDNLPSGDPRFPNAAGDIWQHCINNDDWETDWVYSDRRLNLLGRQDGVFESFLENMVDPVVQPDAKRSATLVRQINDQLQKDGLILVETERVADRPRYQIRAISRGAGRALQSAKKVADILSAYALHTEIQRIEGMIDEDPALAIGTAKDMIETVCKTILLKMGRSLSGHPDLPKLTRAVAKELKLLRDDVSDGARGAEIIRIILSNLTAIPKGIGELRSLYGSGHGKKGDHRGLEPRHARLAVAACAAYVEFVAETYQVQNESVNLPAQE